MLIQNSLPSSVEAALFNVSDRGKDLICNWMPGAEIWQMIPKCEESNDRLNGTASITKKKENANDICPLNFSELSQLSTVSVSESPAPNFVYLRRKKQRNYPCNFPTKTSAKAKRAVDCRSVASFSAPLVAVEEQPVDSLNELQTLAVGVTVMHPPVCNVEPNVLKSETTNGSSIVEECGSDEAAISVLRKIVDVDRVNDGCSSSKSAIETEADNRGECSSSSAIFTVVLAEGMSAKDLCISVLRAVKSTRTHTSAEGFGGSTDCSCSWSCKICGNSGTTLKLLICGTCEEAYHLSCCNPAIKIIPEDDEWFCQLCLKNKCMKQTTSTIFSNIIHGGDGNKNALKDAGDHVRSDTLFAFLDIGVEYCKCLKKGLIGNRLQCREVISGVAEEVNEVICGKWRRAPLFEVQTDNWECFCAFIWDQIHVDCAVPQLRHPLAAKRRKFESCKQRQFSRCRRR